MKYPYLTVALLVIFGIADIVILGNRYDLSKSDWSGWVQAIGSIAALGVAIFVMARQNRYAINADKRALLRRANAVAAILDRANVQIPQLCEAIAAGLDSGDQTRAISAMHAAKIILFEAQTAIRAIPGHELGSYEMVIGMHMTLDVLITFEKTLGIWLHSPPLPPSEMIKDFLRTASSSCEPAKLTYARGIDSLRSE